MQTVWGLLQSPFGELNAEIGWLQHEKSLTQALYLHAFFHEVNSRSAYEVLYKQSGGHIGMKIHV